MRKKPQPKAEWLAVQFRILHTLNYLLSLCLLGFLTQIGLRRSASTTGICAMPAALTPPEFARNTAGLRSRKNACSRPGIHPEAIRLLCRHLVNPGNQKAARRWKNGISIRQPALERVRTLCQTRANAGRQKILNRSGVTRSHSVSNCDCRTTPQKPRQALRLAACRAFSPQKITIPTFSTVSMGLRGGFLALGGRHE